MASFFGFSLSALDFIAFLIITALSAVFVFLGWLWFASLDRKTRSYDKRLQDDIRTNDAFSGIRDAANPVFVVTSDTKLSKFTGRLRMLIGSFKEKPYKIVPYDDDVLEPRKIETIRRRVRHIPGRNILGEDLVGAIRTQYAYKLALNNEGVGNDVVEYFKSNLEEYDASQKVLDLAKSENYKNVTLVQNSSPSINKDPLNDVFLPLVSAAEEHCVNAVPDVESKHKQIENCQNTLKLSLNLLWWGKMQGIEVTKSLSEDECVSEYRDDIKNSENHAYWMLASNSCGDVEFRRLRHLGWSIENIVTEHWEEDTFSDLYPMGESIRHMDYAEKPFVIFHKNADEIHGGGSPRQN